MKKWFTLPVLFLMCLMLPAIYGAWPTMDTLPKGPGSISVWDNANGAWRPLGSSFSDGALDTLDYEHHKIHEGRHFLYQESFMLGSGGIASYVIQVPTAPGPYPHMIFLLDGSAITQFELYEDSQYVGSTTLTLFNNNRNSSRTASTVVYKGAIASGSVGEKIKEYKGGAASAQSRASANTQGTDELILKTGSKYFLRVTSGSADNLCNVKMLWYEQER